MASNPNNALGTPNVYSGLTSQEGFVAAADDAFSAGVMTGFTVVPNNPLAMSVQVGGVTGVRDVAIAKNSSGVSRKIENMSGAPITVSIPTASTANGRLDSIIVFYDPTLTSAGTTDNAGTVGIVDAVGTPSATPTYPSNSQKRAAITAAGYNGSQAIYTDICGITVPANATTISAGNIGGVSYLSKLPSQNVDYATFKNYSTSLPHASISNVALGFGMTGKIDRYGDLVFLSFTNGGGRYNTNLGTTSLGETIPIGYRPMDTVPINLARGGANTGQSVVYTIYPNGSMSLYTIYPLSNEFLVGGHGSWLTSDAWPS